MVSFRSAYRLKKKISARMLRQRGIHGIGVGLQDPLHPNKGAALVIYTNTVKSISNLLLQKKRKVSHSKKRKIAVASHTTYHISGIPVRIIRSQQFTSCHLAGKRCRHSNEAQNLKFQRRIRPVIAGYSVGREDSSGTAGLILRAGACGKQRYLLSNNHVLVNENSRRCSPTLQPGGADGGTLNRDVIGENHRFVKLRRNQNNYLDAAITRPLRRSLLFPSYAKFGPVQGHVASYRIGEQLKKVGRTTGVTFGTVESIHTDINVNYGEYGNLGSIPFKNQTIIRGQRPISLSGDSGSVWLTKRGNHAAAVNFAGTSNGFLSVSYPIEWFMQVFGPKTTIRSKRFPRAGRRSKSLNSRYMHTCPLPPALVRSIKTEVSQRCCNNKQRQK